MSDKLTTLEIVRGRLANGRTIADSDVHKLVAEIDRLREQVLLLEATGAEAADAIERLQAAVQWFIDNDETNQGDEPMPEFGGQSWNEINAYWVDGLNRARAALKETGHG
jgi:hypothetical protein